MKKCKRCGITFIWPEFKWYHFFLFWIPPKKCAICAGLPDQMTQYIIED